MDQSSWQEQASRCFTHHSLRRCRTRTGGIRRLLHLHFLNWNFSLNPPHAYCLSQKLLKKKTILSLLVILPSINSRCFTHQEVRAGHNVDLIKNTLVCYCRKRYSGRQQSEHKKGPWGCCLLLGPGRPELMYGSFQSDNLLHQPWPRLPAHHLSNFSSAFPANCIAACRNFQTNRQ